MTTTKIDLNCSRIARLEDLDELAAVLFPNNKNHQRAFLAVFIELKWAEGQFLPALEPIANKHGISHRTLETVRAKMRRLGLIDHVSRFNQRRGYREGWVFSGRFSHAQLHLVELMRDFKEKTDGHQEQKDRDLFMYV